MPILHMETVAVRSTGYALGHVVAHISQEVQRTRYSVQTLSTEWVSSSSDVFIAEIMGILQRFDSLIQIGQSLNQRLQREVDEWENLDNGTHSNSFPSGNLAGFIVGQSVSQIIRETISGSVPLDVLTPLPSVPLPPPRWAPYPEADLTYDPSWANTKELNQAMNGLVDYLHGHPRLIEPPYMLTEDLQQHLKDLADVRGVPYENIVADYSRYVQLLDGNLPDRLENSSYWGSTQQLRFGNVVGDSLGVDPIFGAMLSPTGGLIGRGEQDQATVDNIERILREYHAPDFLVDDLKSSLMNHGVYHDAAGFLQHEYGVGPGYQYFEPFPVLEEFIESYPCAGYLKYPTQYS